MVEIKLPEDGVNVLDQITPNTLLFEDELLSVLSKGDINQLDALIALIGAVSP